MTLGATAAKLAANPARPMASLVSSAERPAGQASLFR